MWYPLLKELYLNKLKALSPSGTIVREMLKRNICLLSNTYYKLYLKVHYCRFQNLSPCLSSRKNNTLKILHSESLEFSSYSPLKFVFFLKSRLLFNVLYCFCMFVNKHFANLKCSYENCYNEMCYKVQSAWSYFYTKKNVLQDFHICMSVPLIWTKTSQCRFPNSFEFIHSNL